MDKYFIGIDVGTQGARIVLVNQLGKLIISASRTFDLDAEFRQEQLPSLWWANCAAMLKEILLNNVEEDIKSNLMAISVTSTSGTVIPLDKANKAIHPAIMYSDPRSVQQGQRI